MALRAHRSFIWQKSRATLCSWLARANPDYGALPLPIPHLTICTTMRVRWNVDLAAPATSDPKTWTVKDDWPEDVPVTEAEIEVFETWFGDLFDELFSTRH